MPIVTEPGAKRVIFAGQDIGILVVDNNTFPSLLFIQTEEDKNTEQEILKKASEYEIRMDFDDVTYIDQMMEVLKCAKDQILNNHYENICKIH